MKASAVLILCIASLAGCATMPPELQGRYRQISLVDAIKPAAVGQNVRWGGKIIGARDIGTDACVTVDAYALTSNDARPTPYPFYPIKNRQFIACGPSGLTPDATRDGAFVTFTGVIDAPLVFDVPTPQCSGPRMRNNRGAYSDTSFTVRGGTCTVSLAKLDVVSAHLWPETPVPTPLPPPAMSW